MDAERDRRATVAGVALACAALAYSTWAVEIARGFPLPVRTSYASELAALGQPGSGVPRVMDAATAVLVLVTVLLLLPRHAARPERLAVAALAVMAAGTLADSIFPMSCAPSVAPRCELTAPGPLGLGMTPHTLSSGTAGAGIIGFTAAALWLARTRGAQTRAVLVTVVGTSLVIQLWLAASSLLAPDSPSGLLQRVAIMLTSVTLFALIPLLAARPVQP